MPAKDQQTHFGFQTVPVHAKQEKVAEVFHSVAHQYDLMNDLMSFGIHRWWKWFTVDLSRLKPGQRVLDLAGGSGDIARLLAKTVGSQGQVFLADINASMLARGRDRLLDSGLVQGIHYIQANAECLPFAENYFDCITMGFGLRNVTDKDAALQSMYRVCRPGGKMMVLEFSAPVLPGLKPIYDWYSFHILPKIGHWVAKDEASYRYLAESIRMHPTQEELKTMIEKAGFEDCRYHNLSGGIVALHVAYKYWWSYILLKEYSLLALQKAINCAFALDEGMPVKILPLEGKVLEVVINPLNTYFFLTFQDSKVKLLAYYEGVPDTIIHSNPLGLIRLSLLPASKLRSVFNDNIRISGDVELGQQVKALFDSIEIDWEGHLAHFTGDVVAHQIGSWVRGGRAFNRRVLSSFKRSMTEYLQEERKLVPNPQEVQDFFHDVDELVLRLERLVAHFNQLSIDHEFP